MKNSVIVFCRVWHYSGAKTQKGVYKHMDKPFPGPHSHLFTIRVWEEEIGSNQNEWRGKIHLFTTGDVRYFREWTALTPLLITMLSESQTDIAQREDNDDK